MPKCTKKTIDTQNPSSFCSASVMATVQVEQRFNVEENKGLKNKVKDISGEIKNRMSKPKSSTRDPH